jgi:hypothetical protein
MDIKMTHTSGKNITLNTDFIWGLKGQFGSFNDLLVQVLDAHKSEGYTIDETPANYESWEYVVYELKYAI